MKRRTTPAAVYHCRGYDRSHTATCIVIEDKGRGIVPEPVDLLGPQGAAWPARTRFAQIGSRNKSAGFQTLDFRGFSPLVYLGQWTDKGSDLPGTYALFRPQALLGNQGVYFAWHVMGEGLMHATHSQAARRIAMDNVIVE